MCVVQGFEQLSTCAYVQIGEWDSTKIRTWLKWLPHWKQKQSVLTIFQYALATQTFVWSVVTYCWLQKPLRLLGLSPGYYVHTVGQELVMDWPFAEVVEAITKSSEPMIITFHSPDKPVDEVEHEFTNGYLKKDLIQHLSRNKNCLSQPVWLMDWAGQIASNGSMTS